ncbi:MAG: CBS domain-containing protein [Candidatus Bathyarchaeota archaeon]
MSVNLTEIASTEIEEIIADQFNVFDPETTVSKVLGVLKGSGAYDAVVASDGLFGVITVRDLLDVDHPARTKIDGLFRATGKLSLRDTVLTLCDVLVRNNIRAMPVIESGKTVGLASQVDVVEALARVPELSDHPAKELVRSPVWSLDIDEGIAYARRLMLDRGISHIPVVEYGRLVGIVTAGAIVHSFITPAAKTTTGDRVGRSTSRFPGQVIGIMDTQPCTVRQDASVLDVINKLNIQNKSACIMTDGSDRILGILTPREVMAPLLGLRAERELPVYIIGIEDEDFFEKAVAEDKVRRVIERARRYRPDITEVSVRIKRSQVKGERTRYEVTGRALSPKGQVNARTQGWDLLAVFDELCNALGSAIRRTKPERTGRRKRRKSRR